MTFHGQERFDPELRSHLKEHWTMSLPLILLAIPSVVLGALLVTWVVYTQPGMFGGSVYIAPHLDVLAKMSAEYKGVWSDTWRAIFTWPFWLSLSGVYAAWVVTMRPPKAVMSRLSKLTWVRFVLVNQYGFDYFNKMVIARGTAAISRFFYKVIDLLIIDHWLVDGSGRYFTWASTILRRLQTGLLYHYVFVMIVFVLLFSVWLVFF